MSAHHFEEAAQPDLLENYDEAVILYNSKSTIGNAVYGYVHDRLGDVVEMPGGKMPIRYLETSADAVETEATIRANVDPDSHVIGGWIGGDGTGRQLVQFASTSEYSNLALWAVGGGSGGNTLRSTISDDYHSYPNYVIENGHVEEFQPIKSRYTLPNGETFDLFAASVIGHGTTRDIIYPINHESHRSRWLRSLHVGRIAVGKYPVDGLAMLGGLIRSKPFMVEESNGDLVEAYERIYVNMPRIAEIISAPEVRVAGPVHKIVASSKPEILSIMRKTSKGNSPGEDLTDCDRFTVIGGLSFQVDGEDSINDSRLPLPEIEDNDGNKRKLLILPHETQVEIGQSERALKIVTTMHSLH